ncbi:rod shape-determining protein [Sphingomonas sp. S1-29]|uniref:rod shape-determining protein n=1 Tax=Sphingomonas sp. S1-29 TaxID=2991074 RepID=UPI0022408DFD|nr:rod shape-determining protein [Sphingomonas sp. S1-29]UZK68811.1 rod shape-determining protein [Sphingomonas sp. S1-29]
MFTAFQNMIGGRPDIAIDFGTSQTTIVDQDGTIVFNEPSICCFNGNHRGSALVAAGTEAKRYLGRVESGLTVSRPMRNGVLSDIRAASELLKYATRDLGPSWTLRRLRSLIGVPADATQAERRALENAALDAGMAKPILIAEPLVAAIGASLEVEDAHGRMVVECGAGITEAVVISLGGICVRRSSRGGGEELDRALADHLRSKHRFRIGPASAERLKVAVSTAFTVGGECVVRISGLDLASGRPKTFEFSVSDALPIWTKYVDRVVGIVKAAMRDTPPELSRDILKDGLILTGGAAFTGRLRETLAAAVGVTVHVAPQATSATGLGLGLALNTNRYKAL